MKILLLGSGGREHALAWKIIQSPLCSKLFIAPGNAGTALSGENVALAVSDFDGIRQFVLDSKIDLVLVGPEEPLVKGIRDFFLLDASLINIPIIGPDKRGAQLEGSKDFAKSFMFRHQIPTAAYKTFTKETLNEAFHFLETLRPPFVLKADGLAAGKGVLIPQSLDEARFEIEDMLKNSRFGEASRKVVIEEFMDGIELSVFVLTDGKSYKILPEAKDYKRIGAGDSGLNTGGMGAVSPVPFADSEFMNKVEERIIQPTIAGIQKDGIDYKGFIFIGLMNVNGNPYVIEYNVRLGDPETEVVIPRIQSDFVEMMLAVANGKLESFELKIDARTALTVMLVSGGYPGDYEKGKVISGLDHLSGQLVFHAGTSGGGINPVITAGGRVLAVTSVAESIQEARACSYKSIAEISFEKMYFRNDIGLDLIR